jgi:pimeloyl-ACP methyl ester carboxylesterase
MIAYVVIVTAMTTVHKSRRLVSMRRLIPLVAIALVASACSGSDTATTAAPATTAIAVEDPTTAPIEPVASISDEPETELTPQLAATPCPFTAPGLIDGDNVRCGTVEVSMRNGTDATATLAVTIIGAESPSNRDPIFHLPGGPGAGAEAYAPILGSTYLGLARATDRQVVFVDQRGTGNSEPFLTCDDPSDPSVCVESWQANGIDPLAFTTVNSADDIADVASALGATQINVWGASYGSRLALEVARRHTDIVRSLTIESVDTAASPLDDSADIVAVVDRVGAVCAADATCAATIPDLRAAINESAAALEATPLTTSLGPLDTAGYGQTILSLLEASMGTWVLPTFVAAVRDGDVGTVDAVLASVSSEPALTGRFSVGMNAVVNCADSAPFEPATALAAGPASPDDLLSNLKWAQADGLYGSACDAWPHATDGPTEAVSVETPTLVINGRDDSNTPLENAELAVATLANSTLAVFPGYGHFSMHRGGNACAESIFIDFVNTPTAIIETDCVETPTIAVGLPSITTLAADGALEFRSFADLGLSAAFPRDWLSLGTSGAVTKDGSLNIQIVPQPMADLLPAVAEQYGLSIEAATTSEINGAAWTMLSASQPEGEVRLAATDAGGSTLIVLFAGLADATLIDALFTQIVGSITPL